MTNLMLFLILLGLLAYGLERNHRRVRPPLVSGSSAPEDRDEIRVRSELHHGH
ncbi:hypothetical protein ORV05_26810 [Amycolatopsis cynarae]|uniref:Uncharacterized protein n=1 Tax=Amycolatopsis cynarae TaxID=2995223 RepID=A0ABY7AX73_9PSEU|nr:hypothetical protein [Amycolatopsis sp. HUAS 11-8]WAL64551.1 hypothetical protein ORV05_26810 [Amycolatopsis sp. HUAS 11-8]